jgi:hypothetical protein
MTKQVGARGRDAVLQEKKLRQQHLIHRHSQRHALWEKVVDYFAVRPRPEENSHQTERFEKLHPNRGQNDLELIFTKLKDCCDEGETELKEAIKYGLKIISAGKPGPRDSKSESHTSGHGAPNQEDHSLMKPH